MEEVYIILTHTGTVLSRMIKGFTRDEFTHVSISLDKELREMYSFGRLNPYNPFIGGFVHEYINRGTFKRFYNTRTKVYALKVTYEQYQNIKRNIEKIKRDKHNYKFNLIGLIAAGFNKKLEKEKSFYCAEFVKYVIENAGINAQLPATIRPEDFKKIDNLEIIYNGLLRKYTMTKNNNLIYTGNNIL